MGSRGYYGKTLLILAGMLGDMLWGGRGTIDIMWLHKCGFSIFSCLLFWSG